MCANQADYANCKAVFEDDENVTVIEMTTIYAWFANRRHLRHQRQGREARQPLALQRLRLLIHGLYFPWDKDEQIAPTCAALRLPPLSSP